MEQIILDGREFLDKETSHDYLSRQLGLADHYGRNLDALWDCLTSDQSAAGPIWCDALKFI